MQVAKFKHLYDEIEESAKPLEKEIIERILQYIIINEKLEERHSSVAAFVGPLFIEAARENLTKDEMRNKIEEYCDRVEVNSIVDIYEKNKGLLQSELCSVKWQHPELVDVRWQVGSTVESMLLGRLTAPTVKLTLDVLDTESTNSTTFIVSCDTNQFQDLHWKVKEAQNMLKQLKK